MGLIKWLKKQVSKVFGEPEPVKVPVPVTVPPAHKEKYRDVMGDYITPKSMGKLDPMYGGDFVKYNTTDQDRKIYVLFGKTGAGETYWEPDDPGMVSTYYKGTNYTNALLKKYGWTLEEMIETVCQKQLDRGDTVMGILYFQHD